MMRLADDAGGGAALAGELQRCNVEAVASPFLNAYAAPAHEEQVAQRLMK